MKILAIVGLSLFAGWTVPPIAKSILTAGTLPVASTGMSCSGATHKDTSVGLAAGNTPSAQLSNRRMITMCNSSENTGSPTVKCRIDAVAPATGLGNPGDVLTVGTCVTYNIGAGTVPQCIASAASTHVTSLECQ